MERPQVANNLTLSSDFMNENDLYVNLSRSIGLKMEFYFFVWRLVFAILRLLAAVSGNFKECPRWAVKSQSIVIQFHLRESHS